MQSPISNTEDIEKILKSPEIVLKDGDNRQWKVMEQVLTQYHQALKEWDKRRYNVRFLEEESKQLNHTMTNSLQNKIHKELIVPPFAST